MLGSNALVFGIFMFLQDVIITSGCSGAIDIAINGLRLLLLYQ